MQKGIARRQFHDLSDAHAQDASVCIHGRMPAYLEALPVLYQRVLVAQILCSLIVQRVKQLLTIRAQTLPDALEAHVAQPKMLWGLQTRTHANLLLKEFVLLLVRGRALLLHSAVPRSLVQLTEHMQRAHPFLRFT